MFYLNVILMLFCGAATGDYLQNKECITIKEKPNSCIYFIMTNELSHDDAVQYCYDKLNGALAHFQSYDEVKAIIQRYFWWADDDEWGISRLRFGMFKTDNYSTSPTVFSPADTYPKALDMDIWNRVFNSSEEVSLDPVLYNDDFPVHDQRGNEKREYVAVTPINQKWSNVNFEEKLPFICEVPRFPKIYCENDWSLHMKSRSCFYLNPSRLNFYDSINGCRDIGSNLASVNDETENQLVLRVIKGWSDLNKVWLGLRYDATKLNSSDVPADHTTPEFNEYFIKNLGYNVDGTPLNFVHFDKTEPGIKSRKAENCVLYEKESRLWYNYECYDTKAWSLCRKMASTQPY